MTIQQAIDAARRLRDTEFTDEDMCAWLSAHDETLYERVLKDYDITRPAELPYTQYTSGGLGGLNLYDNPLMLPDRYGLELYPIFLVGRIDLQHGDYERWNNDAMLYGALYQAFVNDITREYQWRPPKPDYVPEDKPWHPVDGIKF